MNVTPDQLLMEIGRLHVANAVLTEALTASRQELLKQAEAQAAETPPEPPPDENQTEN